MRPQVLSFIRQFISDKGYPPTVRDIQIGVRLVMVKERVGFYSWGETQMGRGRNTARGFLKEHPEIAQQIEEEISLHLRRNGDGARMVKGYGSTIEPADDLPLDEAAADGRV